MRPSRLSPSALWIVWLMMILVAAPAWAQFYEAASHSLDLSPDPLQRSPRLLGMGRLTLADDPHNRITMWDFARNPTGVLDADSVSTMEVWPGTSSASAVQNLPDLSGERQYLAARENRVGYELWHRSPRSIAYGVSGELSGLRVDHPYGEDVELRESFSTPNLSGLVNGRMPYFKTDRWRYALRVNYDHETVTDRYRTIIVNGAGEYVDKNGDTRSAPDLFTPDEYRVSNLGLGLGLSYRVGPWLNAAIAGDALRQQIRGDNSGVRHSTGTTEDRPLYTGQATLIGRLGPHFEWGADGRWWRSFNEERWVFSIATGVGQESYGGHGKLLDRNETGTTLRTRARWVQGAFDLGASLSTAYRHEQISPPGPDDLTSFNYFLNVTTYRQNADSLVLPDSIHSNTAESRTWGMAVGGTWRAPWRKTRVGAEYHRYEDRLDQTMSGAGPLRKVWDVRGGVETPCTEVLTGRAGYIYRFDDRDDFTVRNEYRSHILTLGASLQPAGTSWGIDTGYSVEWQSADFADPGEPRGSRQQLMAQVRWSF